MAGAHMCGAAPASKAGSDEFEKCLPTAPGLQRIEAETSVRRRFEQLFGQTAACPVADSGPSVEKDNRHFAVGRADIRWRASGANSTAAPDVGIGPWHSRD
jgi:hypothetical protein